MKKKLVRDRIPSMILAKGDCPMTSRAHPKEMPDLLLRKLKEEMKELRRALRSKDRCAIREEFADIAEVLKALRERAGITTVEIEKERRKKARIRGRFELGIILYYYV